MARTKPATVTRRTALSSPGQTRVGPTSPNLRKSGIRLFGDTPWGTHMCMFYETREDLLETCSAYFEAGLERNELCVWAVSGPTTVEDACAELRQSIRGFDLHQARGAIEILPGQEWYFRGAEFDEERVISGWHDKLATALARGFDGVRISGNALWLQTPLWSEFCAYERALNRSIAGCRMLILCTYSLLASRAVDVLDVTRAHQCSVARRKGDWEFFQARELAQAQHEITRLNAALDVLSKPLPDSVALTPSERLTLSQIVRGASSKEAGQALGVSPRTVEFHRANIMRKLGARNIADLVRRVLGEDAYDHAAGK
jgi:DNA-binding CsgD family transcriptional regulator